MLNNIEDYSSGKNRLRRQMKKKKGDATSSRKIGEIKEAGTFIPVTWNSKTKKILFDGMDIGTGNNLQKAKKITRQHAQDKGLSFSPCH